MARGTILTRKGRDGVVTYSIKYRLADGTQVKKADRDLAARTRSAR